MLHIYRLAHLLYRLRVPFLPWGLKVLNRVVFSVSLPPSVTVGRNVVFGYQGLGIVVHRQAVLGSNIIIAPNVVIGGRGRPGAPVIEDDVLIGAGACILGPVTIGRGAKIGANAVVMIDVPPNATAVGVPARVLGVD
ncbi:serine O-acetyltransferase [Paraburkholderia fungorum]|jgi:serine O-acetyltransferase|uniref:Hexapeptide repeat of succinyl-transferase family protein n=1 Tax=Paraburkholderia fungorum TaxID=134537 RepID=A0AAU8T7Q6_9BURK|nr:DapH/DapD/GlmU-related protein [Paraburkholderia fungorum]AJZ62342.1 hexapeptide repeat of succinyl-transferase family protein [Paraburkholderia fungorum]MBB5540399.1 serine O-acetyltransferase [Paraburkholderia fungorum]PNE52663.1 serine acetyltransferase [Paraburkholderia fungorum]PZR40442.1 MAG: serine acetyltransferase [Paraburkholderia fungorum]QLD51545.1 serine acetyltransferase [Paraburkholderia fungorum]